MKKRSTEPVIEWSKIVNALGTFLHWRRPRLDIEPGDEYSVILKKLRTPIVLLILVLTFGMTGYMGIDDYAPLDALYMTVITIATVGFGEISETSAAGRIFTILLIFSGIGSFGYSTGIFISIISDGKLFKVLGERYMIKHIGLLENHFIICGMNETTLEMIKHLRKKHLPFVIIDDSADLEERMKASKVEYYIKGPPFRDDNLKKAHISTCKRVIAVSSNDNNNFAIVVSARILFEKYGNAHASIISIAKNIENKEKLLKIGAEHVITPQLIAGRRLASYAIKPAKFHFMDDVVYSEQTDADIEELEIKTACPLTSRPLKESDLKNSGLTVLAVKREKEILTKLTGDLILKAGDILLVIGSGKDIRRYIKKNNFCFS